MITANSIIHVAILGAGRIGTVHANNLNKFKNVKIKYIYDVSHEAANILAGICNSLVADLADILDDKGIDGVLICTDTKTHLSLAEEFIKRKIPVFCEKPIDLDLERIERFLEICKANEGVFQTGFQRRFDCNFLEAHNAVEKGHIGKIETMTITSRDPKPADERYIRESPSIFIDMMIHDFDMAMWFIPEEITEVFASGDCLSSMIYSKYSDIDTAIVILKTEGNRFIVIQNSRSTGYGYDQRIEIKGDKGIINVDNQYANLVKISNANGVCRSLYSEFFLERYNTAYENEMIHFLDVISNKIDPKVDASDGYKSMKIAILAEESFKKKQSIKIS